MTWQPFSHLYRTIEMDAELMRLPLSWHEKKTLIRAKYAAAARVIAHQSSSIQSVPFFSGSFYFRDLYDAASIQNVYIDHLFLRDIVRPHGVIIDIGANIGQFRHFSDRVLRAQRTVSFEPIAASYAVLSRNAPHDSYRYAIGTARDMKLFVHRHGSARNSLFANDDAVGIENVPSIRLDDVQELKQEPRIELCKIDTEGTEFDVLVSGPETLKRCAYILVEVSLHRRASGNIEDVFRYMFSLGPSLRLHSLGRTYGGTARFPQAIDILFYNASLTDTHHEAR